jgi:hypothetical protein
MAVSLVGSVGSTTRVTSGTTITSTYGQTPTAGNLLVAVVSRVGSTATASPTSTGPGGSWARLLPTSFVTNIGVGSATACTNLVDAWWKIATGSETNGDATFTMTLAGGTTTFAMTCTIYELSGANTTSPLDVSGTQSSGASSATITTVTTTTSANVSAAGEFAISCATRERAAVAPTITYSASWTNGANDGATSSVAHTGVAHRANPASGATASNVTTFSGSGTTAFSAGVIVVIASVTGPPFFPLRWQVSRVPDRKLPPRGRVSSNPGGPVRNPYPPQNAAPLATSGPPGVRVIYLRTGSAYATPAAVTAVSPPPASAQFYGSRQAVRARLPLQPVLPGRNGKRVGAPVQNPQPGPVFRQATQPSRAHLPLQPFLRGRCYSTPQPQAAPVPATGPVFRQRTSPARFVLPPLFRLGRIQASRGAPVINPQRGPPFYPAVQAVRARLPQQPFLKGRSSGNAGAPLRNPQPGPVFRPAVQASRARLPLQPLLRGRAAGNPGVLAAVSHPAPFRQATQPVQARIPRNAPRGRIWSSAGAPVQNPNIIAVYGAIPGPVRGSLPVVLRGRVTSAAGKFALTITPAPFFPLTHPVQARQPLPPRGRIYRNAGAPVRNPQQGPAFIQAVRPARAPVPQTFSKGRVSANPGGPVQNPHAGPAFRQATSPARPRVPQNAPRGRTASNPGGPVFQSQAGPVFRQATQPARARIPQNGPRGRVSANPGAPVRNPQSGVRVVPRGYAQARIPLVGPNQYGRAATMVALPVQPAAVPVVTQSAQALRARLPVPLLKGRASGSAGAPVRNPQAGPAFRQATAPVRARLPLEPVLKGRVGSNAGGPVQNPVPPSSGPVFFPFRQPVRIRPSLPPRGRIASNAGGPVRNPVISAGPPIAPRSFIRGQLALPGPNSYGRAATMVALPVQPVTAVTAAFRPQRLVRARLPFPVLKGRVASSAGAPVRNAHPGPVFRQATSPARIHPSLPPRGKVWSNPGGPVKNPRQPTFSSGQPAGVRVVYVAAGRAATMVALPVPRNPQPGPVFRQATRPIRAVIPQNAPRGRTSSNPGGPVENIPFGSPLFRLGSPYFQWDTGTPGLVSEWSTSSPGFGWATDVPYTSD